MRTIHAAVCHEFGAPLTIEEVQLRAPHAGEVEVDLAACAVCHSDISLAEGAWAAPYPRSMGTKPRGACAASATACMTSRPATR